MDFNQKSFSEVLEDYTNENKISISVNNSEKIPIDKKKSSTERFSEISHAIEFSDDLLMSRKEKINSEIKVFTKFLGYIFNCENQYDDMIRQFSVNVLMNIENGISQNNPETFLINNIPEEYKKYIYEVIKAILLAKYEKNDISEEKMKSALILMLGEFQNEQVKKEMKTITDFYYKLTVKKDSISYEKCLEIDKLIQNISKVL